MRSAYGVLLTPCWNDATFYFCLVGTYGTALSDHIANQHEPFVFIDIGANQGLYSLLAAKNPFCRHVIALEPVAETFAVLEENVAANHAEDVTTPLCFAISTTHGSASISTHPGHSGVASLRNGVAHSGQGETIETRTFSELVPYLPSDVPLVIKVDVEGHEPEVFTSLLEAEAINSRVASIFYEVDERWLNPEDIKNTLRLIGLNSFKRIGDGAHYDVLAQRDRAEH